jgi:hypothetical protein
MIRRLRPRPSGMAHALGYMKAAMRAVKES